ncbi:UNVERIFIED_CONTAM: hypothetical protein FKN15_039001 [Acipenser sinensis]
MAQRRWRKAMQPEELAQMMEQEVSTDESSLEDDVEESSDEEAIKLDCDRRPKGRDGRRKELHCWTPYRRLNCPLEGCPARIARLDRHLHRMHDIQTVNPAYAALMTKAKATVDRTSTSNVTELDAAGRAGVIM